MNLVIVESPAKAKTIKKYLGKEFEVLASYGHVRDLVPKEGAVDPTAGFAMKYQVIDRNDKHVKAITTKLKDADALYLATDPDREGEAISWHLYELLKNRRVLKDKPVHRVVFNEITKKAVQDAVAHPRELSMDLVNAQQARRALDYLVGFNLSPLLWKKVRRGLSAGRVQSPALRLICEREDEIEAFVARDERLAEGEINYEEFIEIVASSAPSVGHCNTMGTATTMNSLAEALSRLEGDRLHGLRPGLDAVPRQAEHQGTDGVHTEDHDPLLPRVPQDFLDDAPRQQRRPATRLTAQARFIDPERPCASEGPLQQHGQRDGTQCQSPHALLAEG